MFSGSGAYAAAGCLNHSTLAATVPKSARGNRQRPGGAPATRRPFVRCAASNWRKSSGSEPGGIVL